MSWAFTEPGIYRMAMEAKLAVDPSSKPVALASGEVTFAVGVNPHRVPGMAEATVLHAGHSDIAVDTDSGELVVFSDPHGGGEATQKTYALDEVVIEVPTKALHEIPPGPQYRFLGRSGDQLYQLPQAVLGSHVHGEIDPHLWHDVGNVQAYVELTRDRLIEVDPEGAAEYRENADRYLVELDELDAEMRQTIDQIPRDRRQIITTHDAYGYLAAAYDLTIAGFVTPNPANEPSLSERRRLTQTIRDLEVPAVFLEPNLAQRSTTLQEIAKDNGVSVCTLYSDAFDDRVDSYVELMRFNANSLSTCLTEKK